MYSCKGLFIVEQLDVLVIVRDSRGSPISKQGVPPVNHASPGHDKYHYYLHLMLMSQFWVRKSYVYFQTKSTVAGVSATFPVDRRASKHVIQYSLVLVLSHSYSINSSALNGQWNHMAWSRLAAIDVRKLWKPDRAVGMSVKSERYAATQRCNSMSSPA